MQSKPVFQLRKKSEQAFYNLCPFFLIYRFDDDEEEYNLDCYDEMHNHVLNLEPRIMPMPKHNVVKPIYNTPLFFRFNEVISPNFENFE